MPDEPNIKPTRTAKAIREERVKLAAEIQRMADDGSALNADGQFTEAWTKVNADYNSLTRQLDIAERVDAVRSQQRAAVENPAALSVLGAGAPAVEPGSVAVTEEQRSLALAAWCRYQLGYDLTGDQEAACRATGMRPERTELRFRLFDTQRHRRLQSSFRTAAGKNGYDPRAAAEASMGNYRAALSNNLGSAGGYTISETLVASLEINMFAYGGLLQIADTITTASGERMGWPTSDDTSNRGRRLGANAAVTSTAQPTFQQIYWDAYKYTSDEILVPFELLEDSIFDLPGILGEMLGERLGRILNSECTTGTGNSMPKGIVPAATTYSAASATAIAADDIIKLEHAVDPAYRTNASYMMHDAIMLQLRLLKDGNGQYLWRSGGLEAGTPDRLNARPVSINLDMDSTISSGKKTVLFGQMLKYKVRRVNGVRLYRLTERYRENDQDAFLAFLRADGNLLDAGTAPIKVLTH